MGDAVKWHAVWQGILATLSMLAGGGALTDVIGPRMAGMLALLTAALQAGTTGYYAAQRQAPSPAPRVPATAPATTTTTNRP